MRSCGPASTGSCIVMMRSVPTSALISNLNGVAMVGVRRDTGLRYGGLQKALAPSGQVSIF
jgi:hypothetical protein